MKKKKIRPFFSIITVVKNDELNIQKTIKSIISQKFRDFEYIVIDGKSSDKTFSKIKKYNTRINHISSKKDKGIYFAMNRGIKIAKGTFLIFVNSGDVLTKNALRNINSFYKKNSKVDFIFGTVKRYYTTGPIIKSGYNKFRLHYNFDFATSHSTGFYIKLQSIKKLNFFNTRYKCSADYDLYYRAIIKKNLKGASMNRNTVIGIMKSGGYSSKVSFWQHLLEETKIRYDNNQNIFLIIVIFCNAVIKFIIKKNLEFFFKIISKFF
jgi:glycosyltransferase involved in cell wall biosynthesis